MKCPGCNNELSAFKAGSAEVDICKDHCGGIWFDAGEFEHYDEAHEDAPEQILRAIGHATVAIDRNKARACPRCSGATLKKLFFDSARELQIDQCPTCSGIWLDPGELKLIRNENAGSTKRKQVVDDFYAKAQAGTLPQEHQRGVKAVLGLLFK